MKDIAIVTGATSGVGREFVRQLDAGAGGPLDEIWIIGRKIETMERICANNQVPTRYFALDLCDPASFETLSAELEREGADTCVQWLINSAGFGKFGQLDDISRKDNADMVRLNCLAVLEMCYLALPHMASGSRIINMASVAAFLPQPYLSVYSASKRFVLDLTRSLDAELREVGIRACAVCPKFMKTGFLDEPGNSDIAGAMCAVGFEDVSACVRRAIRAALFGSNMCITSFDMRLAYIATKVLPYEACLAIERSAMMSNMQAAIATEA